MVTEKQQNYKHGNEHKITNNDWTWRVQENGKAKKNEETNVTDQDEPKKGL